MHISSGRGPFGVLTLVALLLLTGCTFDGDGDGDPNIVEVEGLCSFSLATAKPETRDPRLDRQVPWDEILGDIGRAEEVVDRYWRTHWSECFDADYVKPHLYGDDDDPDALGLYRAGDAPKCGGRGLNTLNASYCASDNYIALGEPLMRYATDYGDALAYVIVAHEWGHAVQHQIPKEYVADKYELQADCFAAAALMGADEETSFEWQDGDVDEAALAYILLADDTRWTREGDHGDALERIAAFELGRSHQVEACFDM